MKKLALLLSSILFGLMVWQGMWTPDCWAQKPIKIGIPTSLTGRHAPFGNHQKRAFDLALEEINVAGGAQGRPLEWVYADDQSKPETALTAAQKPGHSKRQSGARKTQPRRTPPTAGEDTTTSSSKTTAKRPSSAWPGGDGGGRARRLGC